MLRFSRSLAGVGLAVLLAGCPDPEADPTADMLVDQGVTVDATDHDDDAAPPTDAMVADAMPDAMIADAMPDAMIADAMPDAMIADAMPDAISPDAMPPDPRPERATVAEVCSGCGVARSAEYTVIQRIVPRRARVARSPDFTMELLTAPIAPENRR